MNLIEVNNFTFSYPDQRPIIKGVSFNVEPGSFNLLLGLNGSGKTTLIQQLTPTFSQHGISTGTISFMNRPLSTVPEERIGYVMQHPDHQIVTDKVWHELAFGLENLGRPSAEIRRRVAEIVNFFGMQQWFEQDVATLSGGQKQLLNLASTVIMDPTLLILDEPTAQLDPIATDNFIQMLHKINHELGITILITEHDVSQLLPYTTRILVLDAGEIIVDETTQAAIAAIFVKAPYLIPLLPAAAQIVHAISPNSSELPISVSAGKIWLAEAKRPQKTSMMVFDSVTANKPQPLIRAKNIWFGYEKQPDVIRNLSLTINAGETLMILGANGSGKSTLMNLLMGEYIAYRGKLTISGHTLKSRQQLQQYQTGIGYLPQDPTTLFVKDNVLDELRYGLPESSDSEQTILTGSKSFKLDSVLGQNPFDLSGGQQQVLGLLKVLLKKPQILFLDEPTKGLDTKAKELVAQALQEIRSHGVTIIMITHDLNFAAQNADKVGLFFNGTMTSCTERHDFFGNNNFYTTEANRISRDFVDNAITVQEVIEWLNQ